MYWLGMIEQQPLWLLPAVALILLVPPVCALASRRARSAALMDEA